MCCYLSWRAIRLLGSAALFLLATQAFGTTYYVSSSSGSNSNSGTDTGHPWQTISKVSSPGLSYAAGDFILFKCGDSWTRGIGTNYTSTLTTPNAGTSTRQITYGHYVTSGACTTLPVIDADGAFAYAVSISKDFITLDGLQIQNSNTALVDFAGRNGSQFVNLVGKNGGIRGFQARDPATGSTLIDNLKFTVDAGKTTSSNIIEIWTHGTAQITITNSLFDRSLASGTSSGLSVALAGANNAVIQYNVVHGGGQGVGVKPYQRASDGANCSVGDPDTSGNLIADNYIDGVTRQGSTSIDGELIEMEGCPPLGGPYYQKDTTIARNILICTTAANNFGSSDAVGGYYTDGADIFGNIIIGGCQSGLATNQASIRFNSSSLNMNVHNNTIIGQALAGDTHTREAIAFQNGSTGTVKNNILKNFNVGIHVYGSGGGFPAASVSEDYNIFDTDVSTPFSNSGTLTRGTGHSQTATSPRFKTTPQTKADDVQLQAGSPAIAGGVSLGSTFNQILDPNSPTPSGFSYRVYNQGAGVWMAGAFGPPGTVISPVGLTISGAKITGATVVSR